MSLSCNSHSEFPPILPVKVLILQTDNRKDVDYLGLTKLYNGKIIDYMNTHENFRDIQYSYEFYLMEQKHYGINHPATGKISVMQEYLQNNDVDFIVFLDSDAWIQGHDHLHQLILHLHADPTKHGCFSRDPYLSRNDYINSGSFIVKNNAFIRKMYEEIADYFQSDPCNHNEWSYDQHYISNIVYKYQEQFMIFIPHIVNTPYGEILRHNWWKNQKMYGDLYALLDANRQYAIPPPMDFAALLDDSPFPNPNTYDYEYY